MISTKFYYNNFCFLLVHLDLIIFQMLTKLSNIYIITTIHVVQIRARATSQHNIHTFMYAWSNSDTILNRYPRRNFQIFTRPLARSLDRPAFTCSHVWFISLSLSHFGSPFATILEFYIQKWCPTSNGHNTYTVFVYTQHDHHHTFFIRSKESEMKKIRNCRKLNRWMNE